MDIPNDHGEPPLGAILVGGRSRRMGRTKATLELAGRSLAEHALASMRGAVSEIVQVGTPPVAELDVPCWPDARPGLGPAGGVGTAIGGAGGRVVAVLAVDMPFVPPAALTAALARVAAGAAAAAPRFDGRWHPLCGAYSARALGPLQERLAAGELDLQGLLCDIGAQAIAGAELLRFGDPRHWLRNVNSPEDLEAARDEMGTTRR